MQTAPEPKATEETHIRQHDEQQSGDITAHRQAVVMMLFQAFDCDRLRELAGHLAGAGWSDPADADGFAKALDAAVAERKERGFLWEDGARRVIELLAKKILGSDEVGSEQNIQAFLKFLRMKDLADQLSNHWLQNTDTSASTNAAPAATGEDESEADDDAELPALQNAA